MGHIQRTASSYASYPQATADLWPSEDLALSAMRDWLEAVRQGEDPLVRLGRLMAGPGIPDAALSVDHLLRVIARTARWRVDIRCARCPYLSRDEQRLLCAAALAQAGQPMRARVTLQSGLLRRQGAEFALASLEGLGRLMRSAGLILPRRFAGQGVAQPAWL
ncbi:hypothetical protein JMJ55_05935 [Belnapia sp. T6]|uniref:Uncharacterized protein n=1 Tax=Belnapia mucosa TaxID=2804532 RepID=A0ABS1UZH8_9PROT|nr:hypothetical protein [Belnapia mucosa]MBL6454854.1 hypothetical protein [Belnapia mucosa]